MGNVISKRDMEVMGIEAKSQMYSDMGQKIRIEWITRSGGVLKPAYKLYEGGSETLNILDTRAMLLGIDENMVQQNERDILQYEPAYFKIETDVNLKTKPNFIIVQKLDTESWEGEGEGASAVWTPDDTTPGWTVDQWVDFWVWFSSSRFKIISNTATTLTVDLDGGTLPASASGEIMEAVEWYPVFNKPALSDGMKFPYGSGQLFQSILCTKKPMPGDQE